MQELKKEDFTGSNKVKIFTRSTNDQLQHLWPDQTYLGMSEINPTTVFPAKLLCEGVIPIWDFSWHFSLLDNPITFD